MFKEAMILAFLVAAIVVCRAQPVHPPPCPSLRSPLSVAPPRAMQSECAEWPCPFCTLRLPHGTVSKGRVLAKLRLGQAKHREGRVSVFLLEMVQSAAMHLLSASEEFAEIDDAGVREMVLANRLTPHSTFARGTAGASTDPAAEGLDSDMTVVAGGSSVIPTTVEQPLSEYKWQVKTGKMEWMRWSDASPELDEHLEAAYNLGHDYTTWRWDDLEYSYILGPHLFFQTNIRTGTERPIRRIPRDMEDDDSWDEEPLSEYKWQVQVGPPERMQWRDAWPNLDAQLEEKYSLGHDAAMWRWDGWEYSYRFGDDMVQTSHETGTQRRIRRIRRNEPSED